MSSSQKGTKEVYKKNLFYKAEVISSLLGICQAIPITALVSGVSFYGDDMSPFLLRSSLNMVWYRLCENYVALGFVKHGTKVV
jgi:hypothetical protein